MRTIGSALAEHNGVGPGFGAMRVILAFGVIGWHCFPATDGRQEPPQDGPWWALIYAIVPMFFALSGFLVTGSAMRLPLGRFVASRALRIIPALFVDTAVSILVFGLIFTTLPPVSYLTNQTTLEYWFNCVGEIHYFLPGVFTHEPTKMVNVSLWTIPGELCCYLCMAGLIITRTIKSWQLPLIGVLVIFAIDLAFQWFGTKWHFPMEKQLAGNSGKLIAVFLLGAIGYSQRERIPLSPALAALAVAYMVVCAAIGSPAWLESTAFIAGASLALTYLVIWLGLQPIPLLWPFSKGDYSYGIYLYGFPIQQTVVHLTGTRSPAVVFLFTVLPVLFLAWLSWHFVEMPALKLRGRLFAPRKTVPA